MSAHPILRQQPGLTRFKGRCHHKYRGARMTRAFASAIAGAAPAIRAPFSARQEARTREIIREEMDLFRVWDWAENASHQAEPVLAMRDRLAVERTRRKEFLDGLL